MKLEQWRQLAAQLEVIPQFLILDTAPAVLALRQRILSWPRSAEFIEQLLPAMIDYIVDPILRKEPFFEHLGEIWMELNGPYAPFAFHYLVEAVRTAGLEILGRAPLHCLQAQRLILYRFDQMLGYDVRLRKLTLYELEDLADWQEIADNHVGTI